MTALHAGALSSVVHPIVTTEIRFDVAKLIIVTKDIDVIELCKRVTATGRKVYASSAKFQAVRHCMRTSPFDIVGYVTQTVDNRCTSA
jgi:hypothetical protein